MGIAVGFSCLVAVAVTAGVTGLPEQQLIIEDNLSKYDEDQLERQVFTCTPGEKITDICGPEVICNNDGKWPIPTENFDEYCKNCWVSNDPHFKTFLNNYYNWHGVCNYALAQERWFYNPGYYLFSKFEDCVTHPGATCMKEINYQVSPGLLITFGPSDSYFDLSINGAPKQSIPDGLPTVISSNPEVVLAWRSGSCLMIMANKGFMLKYCYNWNLNIWVPESIEGKTYGLCGHVDDADIGHLLTRQGDLLPITTENIKTFATSWEAEEINDCSSEGRELQEFGCTANETLKANYRKVCAENIQADLSEELKQVLIDNCAFDRCVIMEAIDSGETNLDPREWLNLAVEVAEIQADIIKNTINLAEACQLEQGFRGKCFGTQEDLNDYSRCDSLIKNATGCNDGQTCCVDCSLQTNLCDEKWKTSVARNISDSQNHCCRNERKVGEVRPGSGCTCCIRCKPSSECKGQNGRCITFDDPKHNVAWCNKRNGTVLNDSQLCAGDGCHCCKLPISTE